MPPQSGLSPAPASPGLLASEWELSPQPPVRRSTGGAGRGARKALALVSGLTAAHPTGVRCLQIYGPITRESCLPPKFSAASGPRGLLADAVCEPLYLSNAMFPKSVVLKWWGRAEEGDSCSGCTDNEIHWNQISPEHANNILAGAPFSSRAGFLWLLQQFFFFNVIIFIIFA